MLRELPRQVLKDRGGVDLLQGGAGTVASWWVPCSLKIVGEAIILTGYLAQRGDKIDPNRRTTCSEY